MTSKSKVSKGLLVDIILKNDQASGAETRGIVKEILTNCQNHHRGIKVKLEDGRVGRISRIIGDPEGAAGSASKSNLNSSRHEIESNDTREKPIGNVLLSDFIQPKLQKDHSKSDWNCKECTFLNSQFLDKCEICSASR